MNFLPAYFHQSLSWTVDNICTHRTPLTPTEIRNMAMGYWLQPNEGEKIEHKWKISYYVFKWLAMMRIPEIPNNISIIIINIFFRVLFFDNHFHCMWIRFQRHSIPIVEAIDVDIVMIDRHQFLSLFHALSLHFHEECGEIIICYNR